MTEIVPSLVKQRKWYKREAKVGNVVLRKDETAAGRTYKYSRVVGVHIGLDGRVRSADVEYKIPGESKFHVTTRPIHKLILMVPVEEQTMEEPGDQMEEEEEESKAQGSTNDGDVKENFDEGEVAAEGPLPVDQGPEGPEVGATREENGEKTTVREERPEEQGKSEKASARTQPVLKCGLKIVHHDATEEIKDVNQALKKGRGRPRKAEESTRRNHQRTIPQVQARGVCPT